MNPNQQPMNETESMDRGEIRVQMVQNVQDAISHDRKSARSIRKLLKGRGGVPSPSNVHPFLCGVETGLQLAEDHVDGLDGELMFGEGMPTHTDPREVDDQKVSEVLNVVVTEANNENWGNVTANLDRLKERCEELQDGESDE